MQIIHSSQALQEPLLAVRKKSQKIAFVPTMGNLHEGHLDLVRAAQSQADCTVVSIFVNPLQFGGDKDFDTYPRTLEEDSGKLKTLNVDYVFSPAVKDIYPQPLERMTKVIVPTMSDILCGAHRAGHFEGVTTVVAKLFNIVSPDIALFGEKDYQQLQIIRKMVVDLNMGIHVQGIATRRESDGLAMSSRNQYLNPQERNVAAVLNRVLNELKQQVLAGAENFSMLENNAVQVLSKAGFRPDYVTLLEPQELQPASTNSPHIRAFAAAYLGKARLIDNIEVR